ncbi:MAG: hypothetical protein NWF11_05840 [Candidatus Bathyarchaeota archaeon]|nr:hypothetical protein [Candidatus Bathyarchaeota archaeon]
MKERFFRDRDFISTKDGFLFCVVGPYHPHDRVISYLKYVPAHEGKWRRGRDQFKRVMRRYTIPNLMETFDFLSKDYMHYLFVSPVYNITMTAVPRDCIQQHFKCEEKLTELFHRYPHLDALEKKVNRLVTLISNQSGVAPTSFGVTGSILLDIHNPAFSDIDITVYGQKDSYASKRGLLKTYSSKDSNLRPFQAEERQKWIAHKVQNHPISAIEAERIFERKWNIGIFDQTSFSVYPVKLDDELTEKYGDKTFKPARVVTLQAVVTDSQDSIFLPGTYRIEDVEVDGKAAGNIQEVVSYESLYCDLVEAGEKIRVTGKLEHVKDVRTGREYDRVLVGSSEGRGKEFVLPMV